MKIAPKTAPFKTCDESLKAFYGNPGLLSEKTLCIYSPLLGEENTRHLRAAPRNALGIFEKSTRHLRLSAWQASRRTPASSGKSCQGYE